MRHLGRPDTPAKMVATGFLWGWLPCGMVYSALVTAMLSGSAASGAAVMLAFGLGTLPMLLALGAAGAQLRQLLARRGVRVASGSLVLAFGMLGLARAAGGLPQSWLHALCLTPGVP
jgi:sulfite exporter TauE/SafE